MLLLEEVGTNGGYLEFFICECICALKFDQLFRVLAYIGSFGWLIQL
jgi:hypothetical protein